MFGITSQIITSTTKKIMFDTKNALHILAGVGAVVSVLLIHDKYTRSLNIEVRAYFMVVTMLLAILISLKIFRRLATLWGDSLQMKTPMLFAYGFIFLFIVGGATGFVLMVSDLDTALLEIYYVTAHFHYVLSMGVIFSMFAGIYFWLDKIIRLEYSEALGQLHFWLFFSGVNVTFFSTHFLWAAGMPRWIPYYPDVFFIYNEVFTMGAYMSVFSVIVFIWVIIDAFLQDRLKLPQFIKGFFSVLGLLLFILFIVKLYQMCLLDIVGLNAKKTVYILAATTLLCLELWVLVLFIYVLYDGIVNQLIITSATKKPIFGPMGMFYAMHCIGTLGFAVWVYYIYTIGLEIDTQAYFTAATMIIVIPTGIKIFSWLATAWGGSLDMKTPMLFTFGFIFFFSIGGVTGIILANSGLDVELHDMYYVTAHFHYVLFMGVVFFIFASIYCWFYKITGLVYSEFLGQLHFWLFFLGVNIIFFPRHFLGAVGMPRQISDYPDILFIFYKLTTLGAYASGLSILIFIWMITDAFLHNKFKISQVARERVSALRLIVIIIILVLMRHVLYDGFMAVLAWF